MNVVVLADTHVKVGGSRELPDSVRPRRMHRRFPSAQIVVYGHSHAPFDGEGVDGQILFNPGSPTQPRRQPFPTFGRLSIEAGRIEHRTIATI